MKENIIKDNILYLKEWINYNPKLNELNINDKYLNFKNDQIDISDFYFQELLYNENFRNKILTYEANDLYQIIKVCCEAKEALKDEDNVIKDVIIKEENNERFLLIITNDNRKFRFDTENPEKIKNLYDQNKQKQLTLIEFKEVILND